MRLKARRRKPGRRISDESILKWEPLARKVAGYEWTRFGNLSRLLGIDYQDFRQLVWLGILEALPRCDSLHDPAAYLKARARGSILDFLRSFPYSDRRGRKWSRADEEKADDGGSEGDAARLAGRAALNKLVEGLKGQQQEVIVKFAQGMLQDEIAREMKLDCSRVSQIYIAAIAKMRRAALTDPFMAPDGRAIARARRTSP